MTSDTICEYVEGTVSDKGLAGVILWRFHSLGMNIYEETDPEFLDALGEFLEGITCMALVDNLDGEGYEITFLEKNS